jgi:hypothetical protein
MVLISVPLAGANEIAIAAGLLGAYLARRRGWTTLATVLFALAALVKPYAAIGLLAHLTLLARQGRPRELAKQAVVGLGVGAALYAPYWHGWATFAGLFGAAVSLSNLSPAGMLERLLTSLADGLGIPGAAAVVHAVIRVAIVGLLLWAVAWALRRVRDEESLWYGVLFVLAAYLFLTPWFFYWYLVAPVALAAALPRNRLTVPTLVFSGSSLLVFRFHPVLVDWTVQTLARYGIPWAVFRRDRAAPAGTSAELRPVPAETARLHPTAVPSRSGGGVAPIAVPGTSAIPVRAPAAE